MEETLAKPAKRYGLAVDNMALEFEHQTGTWTLHVETRGITRDIAVTKRTVATLVDATTGEPVPDVMPGIAYCSPDDTFDKEIGRQVALNELLPLLPKEPGAKRHLGRQLLRAYLARPNALPWVIVDGHVDYCALEAARYDRKHKREAEALVAAIERMDQFVSAHEALQAQVRKAVEQQGRVDLFAGQTKH